MIVEYDGKEINWQRESIIFPFLPKKNIKSFLNKSTVFMSKQVPLLLCAEVRNPEDDNNDGAGIGQA